MIVPRRLRSKVVPALIVVAVGCSKPSAPPTPSTHIQDGQTAMVEGRYEEAQRHFEAELLDARDVRRDVLATAFALDRKATALRHLGKYAEAERLFRSSLVLYESKLPADDPGIGASTYGLARALHEQGRYVEAEPLFRRSIAITEKQKSHEAPLAVCLMSFADTLRSQKKYAEAETVAKRAIELSKA